MCWSRSDRVHQHITMPLFHNHDTEQGSPSWSDKGKEDNIAIGEPTKQRWQNTRL